MSSRHSAARPKRAGENYARAHHGEADADSKRVKFDVRNPSTLAPDAREDDAVLDADVIGASGATKRGAVNIDGYDSDSDNETFNARAERRQKSTVNILEQLDNYDAKSGSAGGKPNVNTGGDDDDDDDMFADGDNDDNGNKEETGGDSEFDKSGRKKKDVRFLDAEKIEGQIETSKSGGQIRIDNGESSDDEADIDLAIQEEGIDEEVGAGGLKRNAPKVEAFNLREEMEDGQFDQEGNYLRKGGDPDAIHDTWLEGLSKREMKKAADAHEKREREAREQRLNEDGVLISDLLKVLIERLEIAETPLEALARLGKRQTKPKKIPAWKLKKMGKAADAMDVDKEASEDPEQASIREAINTITDAADKLLSRDFEEIYDQERELLIREYRRESGEDWVEPARRVDGDSGGNIASDAPIKSDMWEFRWTNRDDGGTQGPFDNASMKAWQDAGYFKEGVEFRPFEKEGHGTRGNWTQAASFE